jgi:4-hydroxy-3-methylbut-2-en-1-yl diphosphate reductase
MIHNQEVNNDLWNRGIRFIMDTDGSQIIPWSEISQNDIVIIPAFGTTVEIEHQLLDHGIEVQKYNTTCPFVEKVWNRSEKLGNDNFTVVIHGKPAHEETRATFSHTATNAPSVVVRDLKEAESLGKYIAGLQNPDDFYQEFSGRFSVGFDPRKHLSRIGVVNQTTMLAVETQAIADYFKTLMARIYGEQNIREHFADTRDTLCYATNDNQDSTYELLTTDADLAIVVGGYNSSNTSHIVELCERKFPTYFINSENEIKSKFEIHHFNYPKKEKEVTFDYLPGKSPVKIILTSGASCPDTLVDRVMLRILEQYESVREVSEVIDGFK